MNIGSVRYTSIENIYKSNNIVIKPIDNKRTDTLELSELGKYLSKVNSNNEDINVDKINEIKRRIENGTYKVDSKDLAKKIIKNMKVEE